MYSQSSAYWFDLVFVKIAIFTWCCLSQVTCLCQEADRLEQIHTDHAPEIQSKRDEIANNWQNLRTKVRYLVSVFALVWVLRSSHL